MIAHAQTEGYDPERGDPSAREGSHGPHHQVDCGMEAIEYFRF